MKSELNWGKGPELVIIGAVAGVLILGWASAFLPGRVPWLPYSLSASVTNTGDEVVFPVPSDAGNGNQWRVGATLESSPAADMSQLKVTRYLSTTTVNPGEDIVVDGTKYRYLGFVASRKAARQQSCSAVNQFGPSTEHRRQNPQQDSGADSVDTSCFLAAVILMPRGAGLPWDAHSLRASNLA